MCRVFDMFKVPLIFSSTEGFPPCRDGRNSKEMFRTHGPDFDCVKYVLSTYDTSTIFGFLGCIIR